MGIEMTRTKISNEKAQWLEKEFFGDDLREQAVLSSLGSLLPGHDRFIDLGANIGQYSYFANKFLQNAEIICVEANPALLDLLNDTIRRASAETSHKNSFSVINNVVSDTKEEMAFYIDATTTASSIFCERHGAEASGGSGPICVSSITLDELYRPGQRTFIKMDIEGAEWRALLSSKRFLASSNTTFLVEVHPWGDPERRRYPLHLGAMMFLNGYKMTKIVPHYFFGSHYLFTKSTRFPSLRSYAYYFPVLFVEFVVYRFFRDSAENITGFLRALFKRSKIQPAKC
jgi:FkbM family methyltransferase